MCETSPCRPSGVAWQISGKIVEQASVADSDHISIVPQFRSIGLDFLMAFGSLSVVQCHSVHIDDNLKAEGLYLALALSADVDTSLSGLPCHSRFRDRPHNGVNV